MVLLKVLVFTLTFYEFIIDLDAITCPKGQKVTLDEDACENCRDGYYQPEPNESKRCKPCTWCDKESGSIVKVPCTKVMDTKCQCRTGFVSWRGESSTCKCPMGFGLKQSGECLQCKHGYFNPKSDSTCQKWKECKPTEVTTNGNTTSDAICTKKPNNHTQVTPPPTSNKIVSLITRSTSRHSHEGVQTQMKHTTTTTTSAPGNTVTQKEKVPPQSSDIGNHIGLALLIFGIVGLLVLTSLTCKLHVTSCVQRKAAEETRGSLCRRPVEEIGDDSQASLKRNPEEP